MNWQIGDRAVILRSRTPGRVGEIVTVVSELLTHCPESGLRWKGGPCHSINRQSAFNPTVLAGYVPEDLRPIPDEYDGLSVTTWDEVPPAFRLSRFPEKVTV